MVQTCLDLVGIGNAVVDVLTHADDAFLVKNDLAKGAMTLVDANKGQKLYEEMGPAVEVSGGSASNTMAGFASLGGNGAFVGKVRNDQLGGIFSRDIQAAGVHYETALATSGAPTARCLIFVTPDAQRTMQTYLGASVALGPDDIDEELIAGARVTYLEGYLWAPKNFDIRVWFDQRIFLYFILDGRRLNFSSWKQPCNNLCHFENCAPLAARNMQFLVTRNRFILFRESSQASTTVFGM